jgi:hypothetical protein
MKAVFTVDRIEGAKYVLVSVDNPTKQVIWPVGAMPLKLGEGDIVKFDIEIDAEARKDAEEKVRKLITELLQRP